MDLFKQLRWRLEYVADGKAKYIWISGDKTMGVNGVKKSDNLSFEVNILNLGTSRGSVEINDKGEMKDFRKR